MHLRPRTNTIGAVARIRNALSWATHDFFQSHGFLYLHTPLITTSDCEGAGEMFQVIFLLRLCSMLHSALEEAQNSLGLNLLKVAKCTSTDWELNVCTKGAFCTCTPRSSIPQDREGAGETFQVCLFIM